MPNDLSAYRPAVSAYLTTFISEHQTIWQNERWAADVSQRFPTFSTAGKLLRGALVLQAYYLFTGKDPQPVMPLAAAVELMQSSLLVHDDFIDQDDIRRGKPSVPAQYRQLAHQQSLVNADHMGNGLAICVADIGFFMGFELLSRLEVSAPVLAQLIKHFSWEYQLVGLGEMNDVYQGSTPEPVSAEDILAVYRTKTARYTFVLPLLLAGIVAQADEALIKELETICEDVGLIFQIKDDELGIFGTEAQIGKPVLSDVREGKKTLYYFYGMQLAKGEDLAALRAAFGNSQLTMEELAKVKEILQNSGAVNAVDTHLSQLQTKVISGVEQLSDKNWQTFLQEFLDFNLLRQK